jgi:hypothetical protein
MRRSLLLLALAACGNVTGDAPDGGEGPDAGALTPDARPSAGPVTVTFLYAGDIVPDAPIVVYRPDGTLFIDTLTGANGFRRIEDVPAGSTLTVGKFLGGAPRVITVVGVQAGDEITLGDRGGDYTSTQFEATVSNYTADYFWVDTGCGGSRFNANSTQTMDVYGTCRVPGTSTWNVVGIAHDSAGASLAFSVYPGVAAFGTATLNQWRTDWGAFSLNISNKPAGATEVSGSFDFPYSFPAPGSFSTTDDSASGTFRYPQGASSTIGYQVSATTADGQFTAARRRIPAGTLSVSVNLASVLLPFVTAAAADRTENARPVYSWTAPTDSGADVLILRATWDGPGYYEWALYAPPDTASPVRFPEIPASWGVQMVPPEGGDWTFSGSVGLFDSEVTAGWDELRQEPAPQGDNRASIDGL